MTEPAKTETKPKKERLLTPVGECRWAHVHTPKPAFIDPQTKQAKGDPKYQIDLVFAGDDPQWKEWASKLMARIKAMPEQVDKKTGQAIPKQIPIKRDLDENDKPTGKFTVTFRTGERFQPGVFDKYGRPVPPDVLIGNGSKCKVNYTPVDYAGFGGGVALYLNAVQVLELVPYENQSRNPKDYGFDVDPNAPADPMAPSGSAVDDDTIPF